MVKDYNDINDYIVDPETLANRDEKIKNYLRNNFNDFPFYRDYKNFIVNGDKNNKVEIKFEERPGEEPNKLDDYVKLVDIDDNKNIWTYDIGRKDPTNDAVIYHSATVNFKDMSDKYDKDFDNVLRDIVKEPSFEGRLISVNLGVYENSSKDYIKDDMKDLFSRLNFARQQFLNYSMEMDNKLNDNYKNSKELPTKEKYKFRVENKSLKSKRPFVVDRTIESESKINQSSQSFATRPDAVASLTEQFFRDLKKYGQFLSKEETSKIKLAFLDSLSTKNPSYHIDGIVLSADNKKVPISIDVVMRDSRELLVDKSKVFVNVSEVVKNKPIKKMPGNSIVEPVLPKSNKKIPDNLIVEPVLPKFKPQLVYNKNNKGLRFNENKEKIGAKEPPVLEH